MARVDHEVRGVAHGTELGALAGDRSGQGLAALGERMAAAVLVVAAHEDVVCGVEEEDLAGQFVGAQGRDGVCELVEQALAAQVAGDREVAADAGVDAHELGELQDEARGQVVDAEVAHVLEDVEGLGAAEPLMPVMTTTSGTRAAASAVRMLEPALSWARVGPGARTTSALAWAAAATRARRRRCGRRPHRRRQRGPRC